MKDVDYVKKAKEFNQLDSDVDKWQWISENQDLGITVMLDNDDTFISFDDYIGDDDVSMDLEYYIGNSEGIEELLTAFGIKSSGV